MKKSLFVLSLLATASVRGQNRVVDTAAITLTIQKFDSLVIWMLDNSTTILAKPKPEAYIMALRIHHTLLLSDIDRKYHKERQTLPLKESYVSFEKVYNNGFFEEQMNCLPDLEPVIYLYCPTYNIMIGYPRHFNSRYHILNH